MVLIQFQFTPTIQGFLHNDFLVTILSRAPFLQWFYSHQGRSPHLLLQRCLQDLLEGGDVGEVVEVDGGGQHVLAQRRQLALHQLCLACGGMQLRTATPTTATLP